MVLVNTYLVVAIVGCMNLLVDKFLLGFVCSLARGGLSHAVDLSIDAGIDGILGEVPGPVDGIGS